MASKRSSRKAKARPAAQRKNSRRKSNVPPASTLYDKENKPPPGAGDSHEQNWWKINVEKAAYLIEHCTKWCGWDRPETERIFDAYRQFLILKKEYADWDATKLLPCYPVHVMWDLHAQMEEYDSDMRNLLGHVVSCTEVMTTKEEMCGQFEATREALKQRFGTHAYDEDLWDNITVRIVNQLGEDDGELLEVNRREPLSDVFPAYAINKEESIDKYHFSFDGKTIKNEKDIDIDGKEIPTLIRLGIKHDCKIEVSHIEKVAVTIYYSCDKEQSFLLDKTTPMFDPFDHFASNVLDTERSKLVFLFRNERIFAYESPMALGLKYRDNIIDVVDVDSYKCENCVRCNPALLLRNVNKDTTGKDIMTTKEDSSDASAAY